MSVIEDLLAAIHANPSDEDSQLVIGDYLQAAGDPRGDLIVLAHAERRGLLDDENALEQLLLLAAEYSFPYAGPNEPVLPFVRLAPLSYELRQGRKRYRFDYEADRPGLRFEIHGQFARNFAIELSPTDSDTQMLVVLEILSDAIRADTPLNELRFPYQTMPLPQFEGSPLRCYTLPTEFTIPRGILRNRYGLAARDYNRWYAIWMRLRAMQRR